MAPPKVELLSLCPCAASPRDVPESTCAGSGLWGTGCPRRPLALPSTSPALPCTQMWLSTSLETQATMGHVPLISSPAGLHWQVHRFHPALRGGGCQGTLWEQDTSAWATDGASSSLCPSGISLLILPQAFCEAFCACCSSQIWVALPSPVQLSSPFALPFAEQSTFLSEEHQRCASHAGCPACSHPAACPQPTMRSQALCDSRDTRQHPLRFP